MRQSRTGLLFRAIELCVVCCALLSQTGCGREFRDQAIPAVQSGVSLILDGLVDGFFAAIEPEQLVDTEGGG